MKRTLLNILISIVIGGCVASIETELFVRFYALNMAEARNDAESAFSMEVIGMHLQTMVFVLTCIALLYVLKDHFHKDD